MNKLIVHEGGQPLNLDDLDFMQNASRLSLEGILGTVANIRGLFL